MCSREAARQLGSTGADTPAIKWVTTNNNLTAVGAVKIELTVLRLRLVMHP